MKLIPLIPSVAAEACRKQERLEKQEGSSGPTKTPSIINRITKRGWIRGVCVCEGEGVGGILGGKERRVAGPR